MVMTIKIKAIILIFQCVVTLQFYFKYTFDILMFYSKTLTINYSFVNWFKSITWQSIRFLICYFTWNKEILKTNYSSYHHMLPRPLLGLLAASQRKHMNVSTSKHIHSIFISMGVPARPMPVTARYSLTTAGKTVEAESYGGRFTCSCPPDCLLVFFFLTIMQLDNGLTLTLRLLCFSFISLAIAVSLATFRCLCNVLWMMAVSFYGILLFKV